MSTNKRKYATNYRSFYLKFIKLFKEHFIKLKEKDKEQLIIDKKLIEYVKKVMLSCNGDIYQQQSFLNFLNNIIKNNHLTEATREYLISLKNVKEYDIKCFYQELNKIYK